MDRATMTVKNQHFRYRHYCRLCCKYGIKITAVLVIPLLLAIFTVVITFKHKNDADQQRLEDREVARIQRLEDRQSAREQREQDLNQSILTRENDRNIADKQRQSDEKRREQDFDLAESRRKQDYELAERARNSSDEQRKHELYIQEENRRDAQLATFINEIGSLLEKTGGLLTSNRTMAALARAKTLHVIRSIGPPRFVQVIHFLYEANQLTVGKSPLDISGIYLYSIDLSILPLHHISFVGVRFNNVSFMGQDISQADFRNAHLSGCSFRQVFCMNTTFEKAIMTNVDFSHAHLQSATFVAAQLTEVTFNNANCSNTIFERASMTQIDFSNVDISYAKFHKVDLTQAQFYATHALKGRLSFIQVKLDRANFRNSSYGGSRFVECSLVGADFRDAKLRTVNFEHCDLEIADFTGASIILGTVNKSSLAFATLKNTLLTATKYLDSDLSYANLFGACCGICNDQYHCDRGCKWDKVLSRWNTVFCDGTIHHEKPLFGNGFIQCNKSVNDDWNVELHFTKLVISVHPTDPGKCVITPYNDSGLQGASVNLSRFQHFIQTGDAALVIRVRMSRGVTFYIKGYDSKSLNFHNTPIDGLVQTKTNRLSPNTTQIQLDMFIGSIAHPAPNWLSYIELIIVPRAPQI